jgi:hypothetical protein
MRGVQSKCSLSTRHCSFYRVKVDWDQTFRDEWVIDVHGVGRTFKLQASSSSEGNFYFLRYEVLYEVN